MIARGLPVDLINLADEFDHRRLSFPGRDPGCGVIDSMRPRHGPRGSGGSGV